MQNELIRLSIEVFGIFVLVGGLGGIVKLGYDYIRQSLGVEDALTNGIKNFVSATLWIVLTPTVVFLLIQAARLVAFNVSIEQIVYALSDLGGGSIQ